MLVSLRRFGVFALLLSALVSLPAWAEDVTLNAIPDRYPEETVELAGTASTAEVMTKVFRPDRSFMFFSIEPVIGGHFQTSFTLPKDTPLGRYTAQAGYDKSAAEVTFLVLKKKLSLINLETAPVPLSPSFSPEVKSYHMVVPHEIDSLTLTASVGDPTVRIKINGKNTEVNQPFSVALLEGRNTITVKVLDEAGLVNDTYTVEVERQLPDLTEVSVTYPVANDLLTNKKPVLTGRATPGHVITVLVDDREVGKVTAGLDGVWFLPLTKPLSDGAHTVLATGNRLDGSVKTSDLVPFTVNTSRTLTLTLDPPTSVGDGKSIITAKTLIRQANGQPVVGANVHFWFGDQLLNPIAIRTDASGVATYELTAPNLEGITPKQDVIRAVAEDEQGSLQAWAVIQFMPASVEGIVRDQNTGSPVAGAIIKVAEDFNGDGVIDFTATMTTGPDGRYKIDVPRGNWQYQPLITMPVVVNGQQIMVEVKQKAEVGQLTEVGEIVKSSNKLISLLRVTDSTNQQADPKPIDEVLGKENKLKVTVRAKDGSVIKAPPPQPVKSKRKLVAGDASGAGDLQLDDIPPGEYDVIFQIETPDGVRLAGKSARVKVEEDGEVSVNVNFVEPYGYVTNKQTKKPLAGVRVTLYWADTERNRAQNRTPGEVVSLPELPNFAPNQNHNSQATSASGQYAWVMFPEGDYYILAKKAGYETFDSRKDKRSVEISPDSYIQDGIIHIGETMAPYSFSMTAAPSSGGGGGGGGGGGSVSSESTDSDILPPAASAPQETNPQPPHSDGRHSRYMQGYPDGTFRPEAPLTRAEIAAMLAKVAPPLEGPKESRPFADVPADHWAFAAITKVRESGWMRGDTPEQFRPDDFLSRAEIAVIAAKWKKLSASAAEPKVRDLEGHWAKSVVASVEAAGLMKGFPDGRFLPDQSLTRAEAVTVINQLLGRGPLKGVKRSTWPDVPSDHWAFSQIEEASRNHSFARQPDQSELLVDGDQ